MGDIIPIGGRGPRSTTSEDEVESVPTPPDEATIVALFQSIKDPVVRQAVIELLKSVAEVKA